MQQAFGHFFQGARRVVAITAMLLLVMIVPVVLWQISDPNKASAAWFDETYGYRKRIPITNSSSTQTDYQLQVSLDTASLVSAGKLQSDCDDIRFTDLSGKVLDFWVESSTCNTASTTVWVKVPTIPASGTSIYWYYGNPTAGNASAASTTFLTERDPAAVAWPLDDTTTTQSYARVVNPYEDEGRNFLLDSDMEASGTGSWTALAGSTLSKQTGSPHAGSQVLRVQRSSTLNPAAFQTYKTAGKVYRVKGYARGDGTIFPAVYTSNGTILWTGTSSTSWQAFDVLLVVSGTGAANVFLYGRGATGSEYVEFDDVTLTQVNIPATPNIAPSTIVTDGTMEASGTSAWTVQNSATLSKQTTSPHGGSQVLRIARNGTNNAGAAQTLMTVGRPYRVSGFARSDGSAGAAVILNNSIQFQTSSTSWQPFDLVIVATDATMILRAITSTGTQYVEFDDVTVTLDTGIRQGEIVQDGTMEASGTAYWAAENGATVTKNTTSPHGGSQILRVASSATTAQARQNPILVVGKTYRVTGYSRGSGTATTIPRVVVGGVTTDLSTASSWNYFDVTAIATDNGLILRCAVSSGSDNCDFDDVTVSEIAPLVGLPKNEVTLGAATGANGHGSAAYSFDGTNDFVNIYTTDLNSLITPDEMTINMWVKVNSSGVWTDGTLRSFFHMQWLDANNQILFRKQTTNNSLNFQIISGGVTKDVTVSTSDTDFFMVTCTNSLSANAFKCFVNGVQQGSTQTGLSAMQGNLSSTNSVIGAATTTPTSNNAWSGLINDVRIYNRALTETEITHMYSASVDHRVYYSNEYPTKELIYQHSGAISVGTLASEEVSPAPLAYWSFDDAQGQTAQDSSIHNNDGTLGASSSSSTDDPTWKSETDCLHGSCMYFDGGDEVTVADSTSFAWSNQITLSAWFKTAASAQGALVSKSTNGTTGLEFNMNMESDGRIRCWVSIDGTNTLALAYSRTTNYADGKWHHASCVFNSAITVYVDGKAGAAVGSSSSSIYNGSGTLRIGNMNASSWGFTGYIDEVKVYAYGQTADQVKAEFNTRGGIKGATSQVAATSDALLDGAVGYWKMDESSWVNDCSTTSIVDASGKGNNGKACPTGSGPTGGTGGRFGTGGSFDGSNDYAEIASHPTLSSWSVSFWANASTFRGSGSGRNTMFSFSCYGCMHFKTNGNNAIEISAQGNSYVNDDISTGITLSTNTWYHYAITCKDSTAQVFLNGKLLFTGNNSAFNCQQLAGNGNAIRFAADKDLTANHFFGGKLDEVRLYNRALSQSDIQALYAWAPQAIGYWKMDEDSWTNNCSTTSVLDSSGRGNSGSACPNSTGPTGGVTGKFGNGGSFDGSDDYVRVSSLTGVTPTADGYFSVSGWFNYATPPASAQTMMSFGSGRVAIGTRGSGNLDVWKTGGTVLVSTTLPAAGSWHYLGYTFDGTTHRLYVDGILRATTTTSPTTGALDDAYFGANSTPGEYFVGKLDDLKFYDYVRTPGQIVADMNAGQALTDQTPVGTPIAHYSLDELHGQTVNNSGNQGSTVNGTLGANSSSSTDDPTWKARENCKTNGCVSLDGGDFINISDTDSFSVTTTNQLSLTAWFQVSNLSANQVIVGKGGTGQYEYQMSVSTTGSLQGWVYTGAGGSICQIASSAGSVAVSTWYHGGFVVDLSGQRCGLYINGKLVAQGVTSGTYTNGTAPLRIGSRGTTTADSPLTGLIDEVKIYPTALTAPQVSLDMNGSTSFNVGLTGSQESALLNDGAGNPPVGYWKFDEKTGTSANDTSGNGATGTITNATWTRGKFGSALSFDGSGDYLQTGAASALDIGGSNPITLQAWIKLGSIPGATVCPLMISETGYNDSTFDKGFTINSSGQVSFYVNDGSGESTTYSTALSANTWYHITGEFVSTNVTRLYVNGKLVSTGSTAASTIDYTSPQLVVGGKMASGCTSDFNGEVDEVKIYNYARTQGQVAYDYNRGAPLGQWNLDECQGSVAYDSSGNNFTGTISIGSSGTYTTAGNCASGSSTDAWAAGSTGKFNASLALDGTDDFIDVGTPALNLVGDAAYTLSVWVKPAAVRNEGMFVSYGSAASSRVISIGTTGSGNVLSAHYGDDQTYSKTVSTGIWQLLTITYDPTTSTEKLYYNGKYVESKTPNNLDLVLGNSLYIGRAVWNGTYAHTTQIDDIRLYNYALSESQVQQLYNGGALRFGPATGTPQIFTFLDLIVQT